MPKNKIITDREEMLEAISNDDPVWNKYCSLEFASDSLKVS